VDHSSFIVVGVASVSLVKGLPKLGHGSIVCGFLCHRISFYTPKFIMTSTDEQFFQCYKALTNLNNYILLCRSCCTKFNWYLSLHATGLPTYNLWSGSGSALYCGWICQCYCLVLFVRKLVDVKTMSCNFKNSVNDET